MCLAKDIEVCEALRWAETVSEFWMYEVFYNLRAEPFRLSPDHKFCYEHNSYAKARAYMAYAFKRAEGFVMITGRPGTGKTTLIGELVESLARDKVATANLVCTQLQADDLLKTVAFSFGIGSQRADKAELLQRLNVLFQRWHREGRRALLIVDEAQDLSSSAMEELRLLTNLQLGGQPLLQIFLLGQPELRDLILSPEMEQVHQRIVAATHIEGLQVDETEAYVLHRLQVVGWRGDPAIDRAIFPPIHKFSEGVPRRINLICSRLFLLGSVEERHAIGIEDVRVVIGELQAENLAAGTSFAAEDFVTLRETQWVPVPSETEPPEAEPEVYLHAVNVEPIEADADSKKKDSPSPIINPQSLEGSDNYNVAYPVDEFDMHSEDAFDAGYTSDLLDAGPEPIYTRPVERYRSLITSVRGGWPASIGTGWPRGIVLCLLVLIVIGLVFLLKMFGSTADERNYTARESPLDQQSQRQDVRPQSAIALPVAPAPAPAPAPARDAGISATSTTSATSAKSAETADPVSNYELQRERMAKTSRPAGTTDTIESAAMDMDTVIVDSSADPVSALPEVSLAEADTSRNSASLIQKDSEQTYLVRFSFDSDDLLEESQPALEKTVAWLHNNPDSTASIRGFADNQGDQIYNLALSRMRAESVEQYLVGEGIDRQRLQVEGLGAFGDLPDTAGEGLGVDLEQYRVVRITLANDTGQ